MVSRRSRSGAFRALFTGRPVSRAGLDRTRVVQAAARLALARTVRATLARGLDLLGIAAPEEM